VCVCVCECDMIQNCVEQPFDSAPQVTVSKNSALSDNFAANIHSCLSAVATKIGMSSLALCLLFVLASLIHIVLLTLLFWHALLRVHSAKRRHQSL